GVGGDARARLLVVGVGKARAQTGSGLQQDGMAMGDVFAGGGRRQADAMFIGLGFSGGADAHFSFTVLTPAWGARTLNKQAMRRQRKIKPRGHKCPRGENSGPMRTEALSSWRRERRLRPPGQRPGCPCRRPEWCCRRRWSKRRRRRPE